VSVVSGRPVVLVNLTWLVPGVVGGSEHSLTDALRALLERPHDDLELHLAVLEPFPVAHPDLAAAYPCHVLGLDGRDKVRRVLAEQTWLARLARRLGAEVVHHAGGVVPLVHPGQVVLTVQDLQPLDMPENFTPVKRAYIRTMVGRSVRAAHTVCVPSEFTRRRVAELLGAPVGSIEVVPWFPKPAPSLPPGDAAADPVVDRVRGRQSFLYPAITYPHKNHLVLLEAFAALVADRPEALLVLTGGAGSEEEAVRRRIESPDLRDKVLRTGRVAPATLEQLYALATAVVVPSRYEGFGLPVLEAMARGRPVLASRAGSLPEVARAADLLDPDDVTAWAEAMQCVLDLSAHERARRVEEGHEVVASFSPTATAEGLLSAYRRATTHQP
jgi:glycosyltransferase involved in cell wall biosynthesis